MVTHFFGEPVEKGEKSLRKKGRKCCFEKIEKIEHIEHIEQIEKSAKSAKITKSGKIDGGTSGKIH
jgi:hypothetical protein